ncbi:MAG: (2Fe-2S)-binding protein [Chloroflexi bacterium]|nr:(2Fe-2S)-binding protein [Chloroflexota bacterium]
MPTIPIHGPGRAEIFLRVNEQPYTLSIFPNQTLAEILREQLGLTGTKTACGMGNCGACTVWVDKTPVYSCITLAMDCANRSVTTIEGLVHNGKLHPLQEAFIAEDATQCGYCTAGQIMSLAALLEKNPRADADAIKAAVAGNLCRCGTYPKIVRAGLRISKQSSVNSNQQNPAN